ncbi:MAG: cytochrome d ubiquinol oxidase subunit II [Phycisphaerae bacterium]|nr:cytochrome d ubiquinol oxidase subunit II [Gemmatimonadaceae bacterium]
MIWTLPHIVAGTMVLSITAYVLLAGADFGGGVWDLVASGPRRKEQRVVIANALGPVWEANHVWLILVVVMLFSCFPAMYAHLSTELHVPLTLMLVGIVLRGSAFTFRSYDSQHDAAQQRWGLVFSVASVFTPVLLGMCIGTVVAGNIPMHETPAAAVLATPTFVARYIESWCTLFALSIGLLTLALFALLAATYLTVEARTPEIRDDFRKRALWSALAVALIAALSGVLARRDAPLVFSALTTGTRGVLLLSTTTFFALGALWALWKRHYLIARVAVAAEAIFIVWGWAWAQYPFMMPPSRTIDSLAAPRATLLWVMGTLIAGTAILLPSFFYLFKVFKSAEHSLAASDDSTSFDHGH